MTVQRTAAATTVTYDPATAELTISRDETTLAQGRLAVAVDGERLPTPDAEVTVTDDCQGVRVTHEGLLETTVRLAAADRAVDVTVSVTNTGEAPVTLDAFAPLSAVTTPFDGTDDVFEHGYQSWTATGTLPLDEQFPAEPPHNQPQNCDLAAPDATHTSHYLTAFDGEHGPLTLAFLDHDTYLARFDIDVAADTARLSAVCPGDGVTIHPGGTRQGATLRMDATRAVDDGLAAAASAVGDRMDARVPETAPTGWCSWYHYFTEVTADDVRTNLAALDAWDAPVDVVQIDDGYETAFGDWRSLASGFDDMADLRADIETAGYRPGLWLAPFYVQGDSELAAAHPEWLVTEDGEPVDAGERHGPMYGLDTTHPEARAWLQETFATVVDEWGFSYLKLDFLYAAALPGERRDDVTRAEAYRRGLETIRTAVGDDTFVLGCGAPQFPSVGLVDAMRVGPDTAPYWRDPNGLASEPAHENAVRNVVNRQFCHRRLWVNDPDCQLVRATTELSDAERRAFAAVVALTGGANVFSDALSEINDAGRRLLERTFPPVTDGEVEGVGRTELPDRLVAERAADGALALAVFNWADTAEPVDLQAGNRIDGPARCWDPFAERLVDVPAERVVDPHGVALLHCAPARDRPHLIGSDHLANAVDQVTAVDWDADTGRLHVDLDAPRPMELVVVVPDGWTNPDTQNEGVDTVRVTATPGRTTVPFERGEQA
jgi:alpha-galactosidase